MLQPFHAMPLLKAVAYMWVQPSSPAEMVAEDVEYQIAKA